MVRFRCPISCCAKPDQDQRATRGVSTLGRAPLSNTASTRAVPDVLDAPACSSPLPPPCIGQPGCNFSGFLSFPGTGQDETAADELGACVTNLQFQNPFDGQVWPRLVANPIFNFEYRRIYYWCAVVMADFARAQTPGTFFAIGLGPNPAGSPPFYRLNVFQERKDAFLQRIALSEDVAGSDDFPGLQTRAELLASEDHQAGDYFPAPDASELIDIFQSIARNIRVRLVQ